MLIFTLRGVQIPLTFSINHNLTIILSNAACRFRIKTKVCRKFYFRFTLHENLCELSILLFAKNFGVLCYFKKYFLKKREISVFV